MPNIIELIPRCLWKIIKKNNPKICVTPFASKGAVKYLNVVKTELRKLVTIMHIGNALVKSKKYLYSKRIVDLKLEIKL